MVFLSDGNTVNAQLEKRILEVRNYDDEMSGHLTAHLLLLLVYAMPGRNKVARPSKLTFWLFTVCFRTLYFSVVMLFGYAIDCI